MPKLTFLKKVFTHLYEGSWQIYLQLDVFLASNVPNSNAGQSRRDVFILLTEMEDKSIESVNVAEVKRRLSGSHVCQTRWLLLLSGSLESAKKAHLEVDSILMRQKQQRWEANSWESEWHFLRWQFQPIQKFVCWCFLVRFWTTVEVRRIIQQLTKRFSSSFLFSSLPLQLPPAHFLPFRRPPHNERASWLLLIVKVAPACHRGQWLQPC